MKKTNKIEKEKAKRNDGNEIRKRKLLKPVINTNPVQKTKTHFRWLEYLMSGKIHFVFPVFYVNHNF